MSIYTPQGKIECPQCHTVQDILAYTALKNLSADECAQIIKCKLCRHVFAPLGPYMFDNS
jgi:DNA-directed RNA polymerase subunit M/transcription elongation factor TFIIS